MPGVERAVVAEEESPREGCGGGQGGPSGGGEREDVVNRGLEGCASLVCVDEGDRPSVAQAQEAGAVEEAAGRRGGVEAREGVYRREPGLGLWGGRRVVEEAVGGCGDRFLGVAGSGRV